MKIIGIDLGTTNTYLYGVEKGDAAPAPVTLPRISDENGCIATVVLYQDDKPCLIGNIAESEYHTNRARLASRTLRSQFKPEIAHGGSEAMRWMTDFLHELRAALPDGVLEPDTRVYVARHPGPGRISASIWPNALCARAGPGPPSSGSRTRP